VTTIDQLPRLAHRGVLGVFGKDTRSRIELQTELARSPHPLHRGRILHMPVVMPARPEAAHEVLVTKARSFEKSPGFRVLLRELAGEGVFTSEGALWRAQRKLMSPLFQPQPLARYATMMRAVAERAAAGLAPGQTVDVAQLTTRIAMGVVGVTL
jgi:cytochrome P450